MRVCIGGTFNILHSGHKLLIVKAFDLAGKTGSVFIGLTSGELINNKKNVKSLEERKKNLKQYLSKKGFLDRAIIKPITDKYGPSIDEEFDAIVISPETKKTAEDINYQRILREKKPLIIIEIPFILADNGLPISSSRIKNKEIDANGRILKKD